MYDRCLKQFAKVSPSSLSPTEAHPLPFSAVDVLADIYRVCAHPTESQKTSVDRLTMPFVLFCVLWKLFLKEQPGNLWGSWSCMQRGSAKATS